jgi:hypothetical protein
MIKIDFLFCVYIILTHCATVKDYFNENLQSQLAEVIMLLSYIQKVPSSNG